MGLEQVAKTAQTLITRGVNKAHCITSSASVPEQIFMNLKPFTGDAVHINKSPLSEFMSYIQGVAKEGNGFKPVFNNPNSAFAKYYKEIESYNADQLAKGLRTWFGKCKVKPHTKYVDLNDFKDFIHANAETLNVSKEEYWQLVDELAAQIKIDITANPNGLRKEFVEKADKIHKWAEIFRTQHKYKDGREVFSKYYDEKMFNEAVEEYKKFVEQVTGKEVFIGCASRMNFPIAALGFLNNPKAYQDVDFILLGHGRYSSLITDTAHPYTWRFSDNNISIWEYIENICANGKKGKKGLVFCCETDGLEKAGKTINEMTDKNGKFMSGIGNQVLVGFSETGPVKMVESGIRHIKGHRFATEVTKDSAIGGTTCAEWGRGFTLQPVTDVGIVDYNLDFYKYRVENLM